MAYKDPQGPAARASQRRYRQRHPERVAAIQRAYHLKNYVPNGRPPGKVPRPAIDRLMEKVDVVDGCWLYRGGKSSGGYGKISEAGETRLTHRVAYEANVGPIPEGLELDHLCRVTNCVNPDHLEPVTHAENMRRARAS